MTVAEHIRKHLEDNDLSQNELADRLNCSPNSVSRYVLGQVLPHADMLKAIASELGITVDKLLEDV